MTSGPFDLTGKLAVVTGAGRGLGRAMAEALAAAGADIVGVNVSMPDDGGAVGAAVRALGRTFEPRRVDLADRSAVAELAASLRSRDRPVDILVNNAGTIERRPAAEHGDDIWDRVIEIDLSAQFVLAREVGAAMIESGRRGKIIFTASLLSFQGGVNIPGYTAAKSGIAGLTRALCNEWAAAGICVNAIAPGYFATDNTQALRDDPERSRDLLARIPSGRWGEPGDIAGAAVFLAAPASDYVTGVVLPVDGGWLAR